MNQTLKTLFGVLPTGAKYIITRINDYWTPIESEEIGYNDLQSCKYSEDRIFAIIPRNTMEFEIKTMAN